MMGNVENTCPMRPMCPKPYNVSGHIGHVGHMFFSCTIIYITNTNFRKEATNFHREAINDRREATYDRREAPYEAGEPPHTHTCTSYIVVYRTFLPTPLAPLTPESMVFSVKCSLGSNRVRCQRCRRCGLFLGYSKYQKTVQKNQQRFLFVFSKIRCTFVAKKYDELWIRRVY